MRAFAVLFLLLFPVVLFNDVPAIAQNAPSPRILEKVDDNQLVTLRGNTLPVANPKADLGRVRSDLPMTDLVLVLSRSPEQQGAFDALVASQYDASSPNFHHWLDSSEIGEKYGPAPADSATVTNWLASHGFTVEEVSKDRMAVRFSGTAAQVESAFHTEIHNLQVGDQRHIANMSDPQIPSALAPVVSGVKALHDIHPRPLHRIGGKAQFDSSAGAWKRMPENSSALSDAVSAGAPRPQPEYGISVASQGGSYLLEDVTPYDFATIYNVLPLWNASTPIDGTGQTIAIAATSDINPQDLANYRSVFGLPAGPPLKTIVANGVDPGQCTAYSGNCTIGDLFENTLDVEVSSAVAKNAQIDLVVSGPTSPTTDTVYSSANYVIQNNTAKILSVSYGLCELFLGTSGNAAYNNLWETGAAEGIGIFIATGDSGSPACDQGFDSSVPYGAQFGLAVSGLASSAYVTAVGGTDFAWCKPTINSSGQVSGCSTLAPYWNASNSTTTGASAAGYVPEVPWNDSCASPQAAAYLKSLASYINILGVSDPETACNFVVNHWQTIYQQYGVNLSFFVDSVGGGGGASNCTTNSTGSSTVTPDPSSCSGGYTKPSWQANVTGIPSDGKRDLPDVSFFSGNGLWNSATVVCVSATGTCVNSVSANPTTEPLGQEVGGTSVAAPEMAGVMALINQKAGLTQGNPNAELYSLAAKQSYSNCSAETVKASSSCYFNDTDTGTNDTPCRAGTLNCTVIHSGDTWGILSGFSGTRGFDEATGLGSLNVANLVNGWTSLLGTASATVTVTPDQHAIPISQNLTVTVSVAGFNGTPTGNVGLVGGGYTGTAGALSSGSYSFTVPPYSLSAGNDTLTVSYGGDPTYAQSTATTSITVTKLTPTVTLQANPSTVGANTTESITVTVSGSGHTPTGTVQLSGAGYSWGSCTLANGTCTLTASSNSLSNGTDTLTASYSGDNDYLTATGIATLTVNILTPVVTVVASPTNLDTSTGASVTVTVTGTGATPTGSVSFFGILGATPGNGYTITQTLSGGSATFTIPPANLYPGTDTLYAVYQGDTVYLPKTGTTTVTVTKSTPTINASVSSASIYANASLTVSGTITGLIGTALNPYEGVSVTGGGYTGYGPLLSATQYSAIIPPGSLSPGNDTLTVTYPGDTFFNPASTSTSVTVTQWTKVASTITVTPASSSIDAGQSLSVTAAVTGNNGTPTGTVTLTSGSYNSGAWPISGGSATISVPPNTLPVGTDTFTATYSGDPTYLSSTATAPVTVAASTYSLSPESAPTLLPGQQGIVNIDVTTSSAYNGTVTLSCALTNYPSGAMDLPTCSGVLSVTLFGSRTTGTGEVQINTTAASAALARPHFRGLGAFGGATLAFLVFLGIPARRRSWRNLLGVFVLLLAFAGMGACGGGGGTGVGGGGGGGGGNQNTGTTAGSYTFTVTGTGNPGITPAPTTTFKVTVN